MAEEIAHLSVFAQLFSCFKIVISQTGSRGMYLSIFHYFKMKPSTYLIFLYECQFSHHPSAFTEIGHNIGRLGKKDFSIVLSKCFAIIKCESLPVL